jgi:hypothetical protein
MNEYEIINRIKKKLELELTIGELKTMDYLNKTYSYSNFEL